MLLTKLTVNEGLENLQAIYIEIFLLEPVLFGEFHLDFQFIEVNQFIENHKVHQVLSFSYPFKRLILEKLKVVHET